MPEWLGALLLGGGGLIGYLLRGWVDDRFARAKEGRASEQADRRALRDSLHVFLGHPRAHFRWLEDTPNVLAAGGTPSPEEKAQIIADWVYQNVARFPPEKRAPMYVILNVAYQLARGDRHFLAHPRGHEGLREAWTMLDEYAQELTRGLHSRE